LASGAIVDGDAVGIEMPGALGVPAEAKFAAEGEVAGCKPGTATGAAACADGNCGSAERATTEVSAGAASDFHQAQRGPD
jgi:hypothetical protein